MNGPYDGHYFLPEIQPSRKGLGVEIVLEVDDIDAEYERVQQSGYPIAEELKHQEWGLADFRLVDRTVLPKDNFSSKTMI